MSHNDVTIRSTAPSDHDALADLTTLGSRRYLSGRGLLAEIDGEAIAAISLTSGAVVADLARAQPRTVHALKRRRYQILRQGGDVGRAPNLVRRLAPAHAGLWEKAV